MYWLNFLHIYQPISQTKEILDAVTNQSYRPLFTGFLKISNPDFKINLNINGALSDILWKKGYKDVIENIKELAERGKLEFTESAKYHCFLPYLPAEEIERQIILNRNTNKKIFGKVYQPKCFFPPEMAYSEKVAKVVSKLGYKFILLDEISYNGRTDTAPYDKLFSLKNTNNLIPVFRERRMSNLIMSAVIRDQKNFIASLGENLKKNRYLFTGMDGETFGHHRPGLENLLFKIISAKNPQQIFISEIPEYFNVSENIQALESTWASSQQDIEEKIQFYSWKNPKNKVHQYQWQFLNFVLKSAKKYSLPKNAREKLDQALASDQFFWSSGEPWWSVEMIEQGVWTLLNVLSSIPEIEPDDLKKGNYFYRQILTTAFWWQRNGKIGMMAKKYREAVKIPFKERSLEVGGEKVYEIVVSLMEKRMLEAAKKQNYEKAILWRDAIWKLETKNDIYDLIHVVDLLRIELPKEFKKLDIQLNELFEKYKKMEPGQPEARRI